MGEFRVKGNAIAALGCVLVLQILATPASAVRPNNSGPNIQGIMCAKWGTRHFTFR
jgi:hypothetical protein